MPSVELTFPDDAEVRQNSAGTNFGSATTMQERSDGSANRRVFMKPDLTPIPAGSSIVSATLQLFVDAKSNAGSTNPVVPDIQRAAASWAEGTITWTNQPGVTGTEMTPADTTYNSHPTSGVMSYELSVPEFELMQATNNGMRLRFRTEGLADAVQITYRSSEHATTTTRPRLVVAYLTAAERAKEYIFNLWDPRQRILDRRGFPVQPNEIRADRLLQITGFRGPTARAFADLAEDPTVARIISVRAQGETADITTSRNALSDLLLRRLAR